MKTFSPICVPLENFIQKKEELEWINKKQTKPKKQKNEWLNVQPGWKCLSNIAQSFFQSPLAAPQRTGSQWSLWGSGGGRHDEFQFLSSATAEHALPVEKWSQLNTQLQGSSRSCMDRPLLCLITALSDQHSVVNLDQLKGLLTPRPNFPRHKQAQQHF